MILTEESINFLASKKKIEFLRKVESQKTEETGIPAVKLLVRDRVCIILSFIYMRNFITNVKSAIEISNILNNLLKADEDKANFAKLIEVIKESKKGKTLGVFSKENYPGAFMDAWRAALKSESFDTVSLHDI